MVADNVGTRLYIYLHGFNSSPASFKARLIHARLTALGRQEEFLAPTLPPDPSEALGVIERLVAPLDPQRVTLVGSSLGGHYATVAAERHGLRAVLINPAIRPHELLAGALGPQTNLHTGAHYSLMQHHLDAWAAQDLAPITRPERYLLIVALGDEVLDSRVALEKFRGAMQIVHPGGDHGFAAFAQYIDAVIDFGG